MPPWHGSPASDEQPSSAKPTGGNDQHGLVASATSQDSPPVVKPKLEDVAAEVAAETPPPAAPVDDAPDELPAVGKVAAEGATRSLWQAFKKNAAPPRTVAGGPASDGSAGDSIAEEPHLAKLREEATSRLIGRHAAMFDQARLLNYDDTTGIVRLHFPADAAAQATYLKKHRETFALAFSETVGRATTLEWEVAEAPEAAAAPEEEQRPRVVRPNLSDVAAEVQDQPMTAPNAVDVDAVKDDPLVAAVLKTFEGARIVKVE